MLASEAWDDYTNADGSGLAWDVLREVFEPAGIKLQTRTVPYTRSVGLAQRGEVDGWVGSYRDEATGVLYPHWNFDSDHIYALVLVATHPGQAVIAQCGHGWRRRAGQAEGVDVIGVEIPVGVEHAGGFVPVGTDPAIHLAALGQAD